MTKARHVTVTMPPALIDTLDKYMASIPTPPGTKKSVSAYICIAIIERLQKDGVTYPPVNQ
jgi:hypothetical protein